MIIDCYKKLLKNAATLTLYKIDEFFASEDDKEKELKNIYSFAYDTNVS